MYSYCLRILLTVITGIALTVNAAGQHTQTISGNFSGITFSRFVQKVESATSYYFYYNPVALDSLSINVTAQNMRLPELLDKIFLNTTFRYSIDSLDHVFITKRFTILTTLPPDFFNREAITGVNKTELILPDEPDQKNQPVSTIENKLYEIGIKTNNLKAGNATLAGYVRNTKTGEPVVGAVLSVDSLATEVTTDQFGYYAFAISRGRHVLLVNSIGMKDARRQIMLYSEGKLNIELQDYVATLKNVVVLSERRSNIKGMQMGLEKLTINTVKQVPVVFGEADVLKVVLTLPGVTSAGEASTGFNVRGGSTDQNLILFSDATIYNPSHLFGFFSAFNPDVVKGVELYKSTIPEKYGGRLSSVLDVTTRDGNSKKISGIGGIGPLTSKLMLEGPLIKDKMSFIVSGRISYSDWLLHTVPNQAYKNSRAAFSDFNVLITYIINPKNTLYLTGYLSNDRFKLNSDTLYKYGNKNANVKWKHIFSNKLYGVVMAGADHYQYAVSTSLNPVNAYRLNFDIDQTNFRADFNYSPVNKHKFDVGVNSIYYRLHPGAFRPSGTQSLVAPNILPQEQALESALYAGDQYSITSKLSVNAGLRYALYDYLGAHDVYTYVLGLPKNANTIADTLRYSAGKTIKTYHGPEYRVAVRYALSANASVKVSYNTLRQYIHLLSNTTVISPTDVWKLSDPNIKPQTGSQLSLGVYHNFKSNTIETSIEVYYKQLKDYLDYKSGAVLLLNHHIETDVLGSRGKAYGAELLIKKASGKLNGWISYTYARTFLRSAGTTPGEQVNSGNYYPANFDKPHNANVILNYRFSHRFSLSANVVYSTGRPITLPIAMYSYAGAQRVYYSDRNQYRIPDYFRSDLSFTLEGNHKVKQLTHNSWSFGVYNLTARKNAYSVYFTEENGLIKGYKLSIFGTAIPFVTYNIRF